MWPTCGRCQMAPQSTCPPRWRQTPPPQRWQSSSQTTRRCAALARAAARARTCASHVCSCAGGAWACTAACTEAVCHGRSALYRRAPAPLLPPTPPAPQVGRHAAPHPAGGARPQPAAPGGADHPVAQEVSAGRGLGVACRLASCSVVVPCQASLGAAAGPHAWHSVCSHPSTPVSIAPPIRTQRIPASSCPQVPVCIPQGPLVLHRAQDLRAAGRARRGGAALWRLQGRAAPRGRGLRRRRDAGCAGATTAACVCLRSCYVWGCLGASATLFSRGALRRPL